MAAPGPSPAPAAAVPGAFKIVGQAGVPAMHAGLMQNGRVVFLDKVENYSQLKLPNGQYAYSAEYDPATNKAVPLAYKVSNSYLEAAFPLTFFRPMPSALEVFSYQMVVSSLLVAMHLSTSLTLLLVMVSLVFGTFLALHPMPISTANRGASQATS